MTKTCPNCGNNNKDTSKFCESCGTTLSSIENTGKTYKDTKSSSGGVMGWWAKQGNGVKIGSIIGACCLGLILIVGIGGMLSPDATTSTSSADTTTTTASTPTWTEDDAINKVKNYGKGVTTIQEAIDLTKNMAESTGTNIGNEDWSAVALDNQNYEVTFTYGEDVYGGYDYSTEYVKFKVNMETGEVTGLNSAAQDYITIAETKDE